MMTIECREFRHPVSGKIERQSSHHGQVVPRFQGANAACGGNVSNLVQSVHECALGDVLGGHLGALLLKVPEPPKCKPAG